MKNGTEGTIYTAFLVGEFNQVRRVVCSEELSGVPCRLASGLDCWQVEGECVWLQLEPGSLEWVVWNGWWQCEKEAAGGWLHGEPRAVWSGIKFSRCWLAHIHNSCAFSLVEENGKCGAVPPPPQCSFSLILVLPSCYVEPFFACISFHGEKNPGKGRDAWV